MNHEENKAKNRENWKRYKEKHAEEIKQIDRERYSLCKKNK